MTDQAQTASGSKKVETNVNENNLLRVLVVDDDPIIQKIHTKLMNKIGLNVETHVAKNGKIAVELCGSTSFDIILMDMEMPVKNGTEATKEIRAMDIKSMIVGVTSTSSGSQLEAFMAAGLDMCFEKPLTVDKIKSIIAKLEDN